MKRHLPLKQVLATLLAFAALLAGQQAWGQSTFTVTSSVNGLVNTFTITRSQSATQEKVIYRTVDESTCSGDHYTSVHGILTFNPNETTKTVDVNEKDITDVSVVSRYRYSNVSNRSYRFEVVDLGGFVLADYRRELYSDYNTYKVYHIKNNYVNTSITDLVYFDSNGDFTSAMPSGAYYDETVINTTNFTKVTDAGYKNNPYASDESKRFYYKQSGDITSTEAKNYFSAVGDKLYATLYFTQKEGADGYQYIQITADRNDFDESNDPNGDVNNPDKSLYKACFILSYSPSGSVMADPHYQFFPHRYDYVDNATATSAGVSHLEFDYNNSHLYKQKYNTYNPNVNYNAPDNGALCLDPKLSYLNFRFDAGGGGDDDDEWYFKDLFVRYALLDATAPSPISQQARVNVWPYYQGNEFTVSVPFNEIVFVTGTPTLNSTWGPLTYLRGEGTNILCFKGNIDASVNTPLNLQGLVSGSGTIKDMVGQNLYGAITTTESNGIGGAKVQSNNQLEYATVSGIKHHYLYTGNPINFNYTLTDWQGNVLTRGQDYQVFLNHNTNLTNNPNPTVTNLGTYTLTFQGLGSYTGIKEVQFEVSEGIIVTSETTAMDDFKYIVNSDVTIESRIFVTGDVELVLNENCTLTATKGIGVAKDHSLTINGNGSLSITSTESGNAGIGGTKLSDNNTEDKHGHIIINSGTIYVKAGYSATAIGGSSYGDNKLCGSITINGGKITAINSATGPAIGCGINNETSCGIITINGGCITATSSHTYYYGAFHAEHGSSAILTLGWTYATDFINASNYKNLNIVFAEGKDWVIDGPNIRATPESIVDGCKIIPKTEAMGNDIAYATISGINSTYNYSGNGIPLEYTVTDVNYNALTEDTDYYTVLKYGDNPVDEVNAIGNYTIEFHGMGTYTGIKTISFSVAFPRPSNIVQTGYSASTASLEWTENGNATNWVLQYSTGSLFNSYQEVNVSGTPTITLTGLNNETRYYARVIAVIGNEQTQASYYTSLYTTDKRWIGFGPIETDRQLPFSTEDGQDGERYTLSQQIYTPTELGAAGTIMSIDFHGTRETRRNLSIYMVHTDKTGFDVSNGWDFITVTENNKVFSGNVDFISNTWTTITFQTPFTYNGTQNVAIIVDDNTKSDPGDTYFQIFRTGNTKTSCYFSCYGEYNPDPTNPPTTFPSSSEAGYTRNHYNLSFKNVIRLDIVNNTFVTAGDWNNHVNWSAGSVPVATDRVAINAAANIPSNCLAQVHSIQIGTGGSITIEDGGQLVCSNAVEVTAEKSITARSIVNNVNKGWTFIASPVSTDLAPTDVTNMTETDFDLYRFNQSADLEWENYKQEGEHNLFNLENGRGYLYNNAQSIDLKFTGSCNPSTTAIPVNLQYTQTAEFAGWNLVGNPFTFNAVVDMPYYKMNSDGSAILATEQTTGTIPPCTSIMVKATEANQSITFSKPIEGSAPSNGNLNIAVTQPNMSSTSTLRQAQGSATVVDNAIVSFNEGNELEKFIFNTNNAKLYIPQNGKDYAIACTEKQGELPLNFIAEENGTYTITVAPEGVEMSYLHLIDNLTGNDVDLRALRQAQGPVSYTFTAKTTDYESRFKLVFICGDTNDDNDGDNATFAFYSNGNWIIANEGEATLQVVDVMGRILSSETISGSINKAIDAMPGMYVLRLVNGNDVKTQKIVVK